MSAPSQPGNFRGLRVISLESRRSVQIEELIRRHAGNPFVAPSVQEVPFQQHEEVYRWAERLFAGDFDLVVLMTGVGLRFLRDTLAERFPSEQFVDALHRITVLARGPKPVAVLREMGIAPTLTVPEPNTWREILEIIAARSERRIAVQEYGRANREFLQGLERLGAEVTPVAIYQWSLPEDPTLLREAVRRIAEGECDVILFTSQIQLEHLLAVAGQMGLEEQVHDALAKRIAIASIGPVMDAALRDSGLAPDIRPEHPKMGLLVQAAAEQAGAALMRKRGA